MSDYMGNWNGNWNADVGVHRPCCTDTMQTCDAGTQADPANNKCTDTGAPRPGSTVPPHETLCAANPCVAGDYADGKTCCEGKQNLMLLLPLIAPFFYVTCPLSLDSGPDISSF